MTIVINFKIGTAQMLPELTGYQIGLSRHL